MDAQEWQAAENPYPMFDYLGRSVSPRKLRLFGIACCRRIWNLMPDVRCHQAVALAERLVEGEAAEEEVRQLREQLKQAYLALNQQMTSEDTAAQVRLWCLGAARNLLQNDDDYLQNTPIGAGDADLIWVWRSANSAVAHYYQIAPDLPSLDHLFGEYLAQANLLREILGNPIDPIKFDGRWRTSAVMEVGQAIYGQHGFERLPILADALTDAGCDSRELLAHCRQAGEHVRGCWALDLVLGRC